MNKAEPIVAVVDIFDTKAYDIDGDGQEDLSHGEMTIAMVKAYYPQIKIKTYELKTTYGEVEYTQVVEQFNNINSAIENSINIKAVNLSFGVPCTYKALSKFMGLSINSENINDFKNDILSYIKNNETNLYKALMAIKSVIDKNIPVYLAAGNEGSSSINITSVLDNIITVGANLSSGQLWPLNASRPLIKRYEVGEYFIRPVYKDNLIIGYNITGNDEVQIPITDVSGQEPIINSYINKVIKKAKSKDYKKLKELVDLDSQAGNKNIDISKLQKACIKLSKEIYDSRILFPLNNRFAEILNLSKEELSYCKTMGDYANPSLFIFMADKNNKVIYNPKRTGEYIVKTIVGTSIASPVAMIKDFNG